MARFITVLSGKGGVGKTTSAINLGLALTKLGAEVIILDGNLSSPNLSIHLGSTYFPITIHDVMHKDEPIQNAIYHNEKSGLKIIPADISIDSMQLVDFPKLKSHLQDLHLHADYVIIDGSPGLGRETTQLINLSDSVLVITNPDNAAIVDAKRLIEFSKRLGKPIMGIVVTKFRDKKHNVSANNIEKYLELPILSKIPHDERFEKSLYLKKPYIELYPNRKAAKEYFNLARRIIDATLLNKKFLK
ncbi:MAG: P-loop NTPase [Candidatus Woesearchaeota archaeon]|jgi:septum site-determining protein MinD